MEGVDIDVSTRITPKSAVDYLAQLPPETLERMKANAQRGLARSSTQGSGGAMQSAPAAAARHGCPREVSDLSTRNLMVMLLGIVAIILLPLVCGWNRA